MKTTKTPKPKKCKHDFEKLLKKHGGDSYFGETYLATFLSKTHKQKQCPVCGLYAIWIYKGKPNKYSHDEYGRIEKDLL